MKYRLCDLLFPLLAPIVFLAALQLPAALILLLLLLAWRDWPVLLNPFTYLEGVVCAFKNWLAILIIWAAISALWSLDSGGSLSSAFALMLLCSLGWLASMLLDKPFPPTTRTLYVTLALFTACVAVLLLEQIPGASVIAFVSSQLGGDYERFMQKSVNRSLCAFVVLVWPFIYLLHRLNRRWLAWLLLAMLAVPVFCMHSLSAQLGLATGIFVYAVCRAWPSHAPRLFVALIPLLFFVLPWLTAWVLHSSVTASAIPTLSAMSAGRIPIWDSLLQQSTEKPTFGGGMDTSHEVPMDAATMQAIGLKTPPLHPHHSALQVKLELGIIGLILASLAIWQALRRIHRHTAQDHAPLALACAAAYLGAGFSSFGVWQNWWVACAWIAFLLWRRFSSYRPA